VGCHRCWSYVLEQLNVIYLRAHATLRYVHDDADCGAGGKRWPPAPSPGRGDFDPVLGGAAASARVGATSTARRPLMSPAQAFVRGVFEAMVG